MNESEKYIMANASLVREVSTNPLALFQALAFAPEEKRKIEYVRAREFASAREAEEFASANASLFWQALEKEKREKREALAREALASEIRSFALLESEYFETYVNYGYELKRAEASQTCNTSEARANIEKLNRELSQIQARELRESEALAKASRKAREAREAEALATSNRISKADTFRPSPLKALPALHELKADRNGSNEREIALAYRIDEYEARARALKKLRELAKQIAYKVAYRVEQSGAMRVKREVIDGRKRVKLADPAFTEAQPHAMNASARTQARKNSKVDSLMARLIEESESALLSACAYKSVFARYRKTGKLPFRALREAFQACDREFTRMKRTSETELERITKAEEREESQARALEIARASLPALSRALHAYWEEEKETARVLKKRIRSQEKTDQKKLRELLLNPRAFVNRKNSRRDYKVLAERVNAGSFFIGERARIPSALDLREFNSAKAKTTV